MSTKRGRNGRKSGNGTTGKEAGNGSRYRVVAGEDFTDLTQPSELEVWLGKFKKWLLWACVVALTALISTLVTVLATPLANILLEKLRIWLGLG